MWHFPCPNNCGRIYKYKSSMVKHCKLECGKEPEFQCAFVCPNKCGRKYRYKKSLSRHLKYECGMKPQFKCKVCGRQFMHNMSLRIHLGLIHKIIK
ncbi:hypothetical protein PGB90_007332 [Kerria lacca]